MRGPHFLVVNTVVCFRPQRPRAQVIPRLRVSSGKPNGPWLVMVDGDGAFDDASFKIPLKAECAALLRHVLALRCSLVCALH